MFTLSITALCVLHWWMLFLFLHTVQFPRTCGTVWHPITKPFRSMTSVWWSKARWSLRTFGKLTAGACPNTHGYSVIWLVNKVCFVFSLKQSEDHPEEETVRWRCQPVGHPAVGPRRPPRGLLPPEQQRRGVGRGPELHRAAGRELAAAAALPRRPAETDHTSRQRQPPDTGDPEGPDGRSEGSQEVPLPGLGRHGQQCGYLHSASAAARGPAPPLRLAQQPPHYLWIQGGAGTQRLQPKHGDLCGGAQSIRGGGCRGRWERGGGGQAGASSLGLQRRKHAKKCASALLWEVIAPERLSLRTGCPVYPSVSPQPKFSLLC